MKDISSGITTVAGAAQILKVTPAGVRRLESMGKLPSVRLVGPVRQRLFLVEDVERLAAERGARN